MLLYTNAFNKMGYTYKAYLLLGMGRSSADFQSLQVC